MEKKQWVSLPSGWREQLPVAASVVGYAIWGCSFLFIRLASQIAEMSVMLSIRFLVALALMTGMMAAGKGHLELRGRSWKELAVLLLRGWVYFLFESYGILYANATLAGVILAACPVLTLGMGKLFLREEPTRRQVLFSPLPVVGVVLITLASGSSGSVRTIGVILLLGAMVLSALDGIIIRLASRSYSSFETTYYSTLGCGIGFTAEALVKTRGSLRPYVQALAQPKFVLLILAMSLLCSILCNLLVNWAAGEMPAGKLASFRAMETLVSMLAGVVVLHEPVTWALVAGAGLILFGVWQVTREERSGEPEMGEALTAPLGPDTLSLGEGERRAIRQP